MSKEKYPEQPILIVDDEENFLESIKATLRKNGITNVECCSESINVLAKIKSNKYSIILLDIRMPDKSGDELLPIIVENFPDIPVILLTAVADEPIAKDCKEKGAYDYLVKPFEMYELIFSIQNALKFKNVYLENNRLRERILSGMLERPECFKNIITQNKKMLRIFIYIEAIAESHGPVLITGEPGTGKELISRAIHKASNRNGNLVCRNVAGLDDFLFSDTLFGHIKGAFTGAINSRKGMIEEANNGTLFLDEIGDLSMKSQVKLLRLIQEGEYFPLGMDKPKISNARIVVATNQNIEEEIQNGKFRKDLYSRLKGHRIHLPPLRNRKEDIPLLVEHFIRKTDPNLEENLFNELKTKLLDFFSNRSLDENIREIENTTIDAMERYKKGIPLEEQFGPEEENDAQPEMSFFSMNENPPDDNSYSNCDDLKNAYEENEEGYEYYKVRRVFIIQEALKRNKNNKSSVAELLDIPRSTINNILNMTPISRQKKENL